jgi:hypothetical protein
MSQRIPSEALEYERCVDRLRRTNSMLLDACETFAEDCRMALKGDWDKGGDGFRASLQLLEDVIANAKPDSVCGSGKVIGLPDLLYQRDC